MEKMEPRRIINLACLKETFSDIPPIILRYIIQIYALPYPMAIKRLNDLSEEIYQMGGTDKNDVWVDLRNALEHMSPIERENLRTECVKEVVSTLFK